MITFRSCLFSDGRSLKPCHLAAPGKLGLGADNIGDDAQHMMASYQKEIQECTTMDHFTRKNNVRIKVHKCHI